MIFIEGIGFLPKNFLSYPLKYGRLAPIELIQKGLFMEELHNVFLYSWLAIGFVFLILEILAAAGMFFFISLAIGCFGAAVCAVFDVPFFYQLWAMPLVTLASFVLLKKGITFAKPKKLKTNVDALMGLEAVVLQPLEPYKGGYIRVRQEEWAAIAEDNQFYDKNTKVVVIRISGNKLVVKQK